MAAKARLEKEELAAELEKVKVKIKETDDLIHNLILKKRKLIETATELKAKCAKCVPNKWLGKAWESSDFEWSSEIQKAMKDTFKIENFRPFQLSAINAVMAGQDCLLLMPTGAGKSLCYQLPAKVLKGITLVVSPLVSLMEDQVMSLQEFNLPAVLLSSTVSFPKINETLTAMSDKNCPLKLIYVTPERLSKSKTFFSALEKAYENGMFSLLAIDEVHCCSHLGHDFRTDYKILGIMKRQFPRVPILGVTATATPEILEDVKQFLALQECLTVKVPFNRSNLRYQPQATQSASIVPPDHPRYLTATSKDTFPSKTSSQAGVSALQTVISKPSKSQDALYQLLSFLQSRFKGCSGIIYCFTVTEANDVASFLCDHGIKAASYHAVLDSDVRTSVHKEWASNKIQVVAATLAFGMGINKPDVRFVIHYTMPKSMETYYQESGRAGRDGSFAECILFCDVRDMFKLSVVVNRDQKALKKLYLMVEYCLDLTRCRRVMIAQQFKEQWDKMMCNKMCDHCEVNLSHGSEKDMTEQCLYMFTIIKHCSSKNQRITAQKLINICIGKSPEHLKLLKQNISKLLDQESYEYLLVLMVIGGYLKESFSFAPYQVISYIDIGDLYKDEPLLSMKISFMMPSKKKHSHHRSLASSDEESTILVEDVTEKTDSAFHDFQHNSKRQKITNPEALITKSKQTSCIKKMPTCTVTSSLQQAADTAELIIIDDSSGDEVSFISSEKNV